MSLSAIAKVDKFLSDIRSVSPEKFEIVMQIREIFLNASSELAEEIKYGGLLFRRSNQLIGGVFVYKQHLSIEFGSGAQLDDPENLLEGQGKYRRHLKIRQIKDVERKRAGEFVTKALAVDPAV